MWMSLKEVRAPLSKVEVVDNREEGEMGRRKAAGPPPPPPVLMHLALFGDASSVTRTPQKTQLRARALSIIFSRRFISSRRLTWPLGDVTPPPNAWPRPRASAVLGYWIRRRQQRAPVQSMSAHWQWHVASARTSHEPQAEPHVQPVTAKPAGGARRRELGPRAGSCEFGVPEGWQGGLDTSVLRRWGPGVGGRDTGGSADQDIKQSEAETPWF